MVCGARINIHTMKRSLETRIIEDYDNDPIAYCNGRYPGITRWELDRTNNQLYKILRKRELLHRIPRQRAEFGPDTWKCYVDNWFGLSRYQLRCVSPSFYNRMRYEGLLSRIPLLDRKEVWKDRKKYAPTALAHCRRELPNKTRGEIKKLNPSLYNTLIKEGTLRYIRLN